MFTKELLTQQLKDMGISSDDALMLHSSMKAIGEVAGGADTVLDAFMEYLSAGLFMTPTHTWRQMSADYCVFDPSLEPSCVGILSDLFWRRPGVYRSLHPTHSIAACGKGAAEYVQGEEFLHTPCDPSGCFGRLKDIRAKILLVGVTHVKNTYIHSIEESFDVKERLTEEPVLFYVVRPDGTRIPVPMHRHYNSTTAHISEAFDLLKDYYFETGAAKGVRFGDADCILCEAEKLFDATAAVLKDKPDFFIPYVKN